MPSSSEQSRSPDPLAVLDAALRAWAAEAQIPVVAGSVEAPRHAVVVDLAGGRGVAEASTAAEARAAADALVAALQAATARAGAQLLVLTTDRLKADERDEALELLRARNAPPAVLRVAERARVGAVSGVFATVVVASPPMLVRGSAVASWWSHVYEPRTLLPPEEDPAAAAREAERAADERERRTWTGTKQTDAARRVLAHPSFAVARTEKARLVLLREVLGEDAPANETLLREIAREAQAMAELGLDRR